jgi:hypothetical protein
MTSQALSISNSVYTFLNLKNPFGLDTYQKTSVWRRFSLSIDHSTAVDNRHSDLGGNTNTYMAKAVVHGFRDIAVPSNSSRYDAVLKNYAVVTGELARLAAQVADYLYPVYGNGQTKLEFRALLNSNGFRQVAARFTRADLQAIGGSIAQYLASNIAFDKALDATAKAIQTQLQIGVDFTSRLSYSGGSNLYRGEVIFDKGFNGGAWNSTTNLSYDFSNARTAASENRQIIRMVEAVSVPVKTFGHWKQDPMVPSISGEADYGTNGTPIYRAQFKISIPLRLGWAVPFAVQYSNRTSVGPRADAKALIGLTFDLAKGIIDISTPDALRSKYATPAH